MLTHDYEFKAANRASTLLAKLGVANNAAHQFDNLAVRDPNRCNFTHYTLADRRHSVRLRADRFREGDGERRLVYLSIPVLEAPLFEYSLLLHEATHLWSMKTTLLGCVMPAVAAGLWDVLLGAYVPILEGLACYAELDYFANAQSTAYNALKAGESALSPAPNHIYKSTFPVCFWI